MANASITDVAHEQLASSIKSNAVRLAELCFGSRPTVAGETRFARTRYGGNKSSLSINPADDMRVPFNHEQIAV
jgi:hypothetical protein|tara:strand:+ start:163 stop:384 length:222 start_codon:yes stop_codon:yes gene_type:complete